MNLKTLADLELIDRTQNLVNEERALLTKILHHLREIERRRLFSEYGYKSLFDFAVRSLGYSEDQAYRRIAAMRLLKEIPEIEEKINSGTVNLSHISLAQSLFRREEKLAKSDDSGKIFAKQEKLNVLDQIAGKSAREAERITLSLSSLPEAVKPEQVRPLTETHTELRLAVDNETLNMINRLKGRLAHQHPNLSTVELVKKLCQLGLDTWTVSPATFQKSRVKSSKAETRRQVFRNAKNQCEICQSEFGLEVDHKIPRAKGGRDTPENLRLLCRSCNQRAAIKELGLGKMHKFINKN